MEDKIMEHLKELIKDPYKYALKMQLKALVDLLKLCSDRYYNSSKPLVDDATYDILIEVLKERSPNNSLLHNIGAPVKSKNKVNLPYWMGSMDKLKESDQIAKWIKKYKGPYVISDKLDGISCLIYVTEDEIKLYTRGDGNMGQDISKLLPYLNSYNNIKKLPEYINKKKSHIAIRGELIMSVKKFKKYSDKFANARNTVAGFVNSKTIDKDLQKSLKDVDFISYEIINPWSNQSEQFKMLEKWGLQVTPHKLRKNIDFDYLTKYLTDRKGDDTNYYEIDGIIICDDNNHHRNIDGNPSYSFAFKMMGDIAVVNVVEVEWQPSTYGYIIPTVKLEPTQLNGVTITYTTGFNAKYIVDNEIGPGAIVKLVRSGDVIPYIVAVIKGSKNGPQLPDPKKYKYHWYKSKNADEAVHIILDDDIINDTVEIKRIVKFLRTLGVENVSEGIIKKLYEDGYDDIIKVLKITVDDLIDIDGIQEKMATKIYNNINEKLNNVNLVQLMVASNQFGHGFGERKIKKVVEDIPKVKDMLDEVPTKTELANLKEEIIELDGFNETTAEYFIEGFPKFVKFYKKISKFITLEKKKKVNKTSNKFEGMTIVFTGFRNKEWQKYVEDNGGKVSSSVSKNTTMIVYKEVDKGSAKYNKAISLGVKAITTDEFEKLIK
jgi:NAD-dependent DNA ligase